MDVAIVLQAIVNGLMMGGVYALIAVGSFAAFAVSAANVSFSPMRLSASSSTATASFSLTIGTTPLRRSAIIVFLAFRCRWRLFRSSCVSRICPIRQPCRRRGGLGAARGASLRCQE